MKVFEIGTGYTSIPAKMGAATEIVVEELTKSMLKKGIDVTIVDIKDKNRLTNNLPIVEANIPQILSSTDTKLGIVHKLKRVLYSVSLTFKLHSLIMKVSQKGKIVLHFHNQYNLYFFLKLTSEKMRKRVEIAYTVHSYVWQGNWDDIKDTIVKRYFLEVECVKHADKVFVLNEITLDHLVRQIGVGVKKIILIANGVNAELYKPMDNAESKQNTIALGLDQSFVFFQAGSVCERKKQLTSVKLLMPLMKENKSVTFVYAGGIISPEYKQQIDDFLKQNDIDAQVRYVGELSPGQMLNAYYNAAKAFLFPSVQEGFSLVILEAMSVGVPVFVNANNGLKIPDGGCLRYKDENDFIALVKTYILDYKKQKELSAQSRQIVEIKYSWDIISAEYLKNF